MKKIKTIMTVLLLVAALSSVNAQDANTILKKMDDVRYSRKDMRGKTKIVLIDKNGVEKTREANVIQKGNDKRIFS